MISDLANTLTNTIFPTALNAVAILMPIWVPILLAVVLFRLWMTYVRYKFIQKAGSVLLEIRLPKEHWKGFHTLHKF